MIVVDASVWLSYLVESDINHEASNSWLSGVLAEGEVIVAPVILLAEIAGAIARQTGNEALAQKTIDCLLSIPNLRLVIHDYGLSIQAARVAAALRLRGADASYVAVAATIGVPFVSWDKEQLMRAKVVTTTIHV